MNEKNLAKQFAYLSELRAMKDRKLFKHHRGTFYPGHKFHVNIPKWMHRTVMERRLWYYYAAKNYHYPPDSPFSIQFRKVAKHVLSKEYIQSIDKHEETQQQEYNLANFTKDNIKAMSINEVDRYLASIGLYVEQGPNTRRKILWEWYNARPKELIKHHNKKGKLVRRKGTLNNKFRLRDLILEDPTLSYDAFLEQYGERMPTVTRGSFNVTRCLLRKAGYDIPKLNAGANDPAVRKGVHGLVKARPLNRLRS